MKYTLTYFIENLDIPMSGLLFIDFEYENKNQIYLDSGNNQIEYVKINDFLINLDNNW